jgi:hypothetical protein
LGQWPVAALPAAAIPRECHTNRHWPSRCHITADRQCPLSTHCGRSGQVRRPKLTVSAMGGKRTACFAAPGAVTEARRAPHVYVRVRSALDIDRSGRVRPLA